MYIIKEFCKILLTYHERLRKVPIALISSFLNFLSYKKLFYFLILSCNKDFDLLKILKSYNTNDIIDANIYIKENGEIALYSIQIEMNKLTYSTIFKIK